mgnify:CR=1 FL=1
MNIVLGSMFQNSVGYIDRYITQYYSLCAAAPQHTFDLILMEGDSTDNEATWNRLNQIFPGKVFKRVHGGKIFGSFDNEQRWKQISFVVDGVLERVRPEHDALVYVEADLMWEPSTILKLIGHLDKVDAAVPMIWMNGIFYDIWGYRKDTVNFIGRKPYHAVFAQPSKNGLWPIDSGGGCMAVRGEMARKFRCNPPKLALVGFYTEMKRNGFQTWVDPTLNVFHPPI